MKDILKQTEETILKVELGEIDILPALIEIEETKKYLDNILDKIKNFKYDNLENIESSAKEYQNEFGGYKIEVRSGGRMYNFKNIEEWKTYNKALKDCEARSKQALLSIEKGMQVASVDGEEIQLPEVTYRKSSIILKKNG